MNAERWRAWWGAWWVAIPLVLTAAVSYPITRNYFYGDDLLSIYDVINKHLAELLLVPYGGHLLIVRNAVSLLLFRLFGPDPHAYYWVAVLTHLVNVGLLCALLRRLTASARLACFGGAMWGSAPVTEGTIGWYSVYGHALATTALLLILAGVVRAGRRGAVSTLELCGWAVLVVSASTCFGVGLAFAVVLPVVAWLLLPRGRVRRRAVGLLGLMAVVMPAIYLVAQRIALEWFGSPQLPVEVGMLAEKSFGIADMLVNMLAYGIEQIVLGPLAHFARGLGWAAAVATPVALAIGVAGWKAAPTARRAMLAFALLPTAAYGIIAAGRSAFYPGLRELLIRADRYHYAAPLALTVLICLALAQVEVGRLAAARLREVALSIWLIALVTGLAVARAPVQHFDWARRLADGALASMQRVIDGTPPGEDVYIENQVFRGVGPFVIAVPSNFPGWAALFVVFHPSNVVDGHRVFFVEPDADVREGAARGVRSATLLIAPEEAPAGRVQRAAPPPAAPPPAPAAAPALPLGD